MGIDMFDAAPGIRIQNRYSQFFHEFALQCFFNCFTGFNLASRKFPVSFIWFAGRSLCQQDISVFFHEDTDIGAWISGEPGNEISRAVSGLLGTLSGGGSLGEAVEVFCENLEASAPD